MRCHSGLAESGLPGVTDARLDGGTAFDEITRTDIEAARALAAWEWKPDVTLVKVRPCRWQDCGGSVLCFGGEVRCLLCCRPPGD